MATSLRLGESRLPSLLRKADMTQAEFARRLGVSRQYITKIIKRERTFTLEQGIHAGFILNCDTNDLYVIEFINRRE